VTDRRQGGADGGRFQRIGGSQRRIEASRRRRCERKAKVSRYRSRRVRPARPSCDSLIQSPPARPSRVVHLCCRSDGREKARVLPRVIQIACLPRRPASSLFFLPPREAAPLGGRSPDSYQTLNQKLPKKSPKNEKKPNPDGGAGTVGGGICVGGRLAVFRDSRGGGVVPGDIAVRG
jgi:hypothetical protein